MKKRILIVSDDSRLTEVVQRQLETSSEFIAVIASSIQAAMELALQLKPHLILVDVAPPAELAEMICTRLNRDWETHEIPRLLLLDPNTLNGPVTEATQRLKAVDHILKPLQPDQLVAKVTAIFRGLHQSLPPREIYYDGRLYIDFNAFVVRANGTDVKVTLKEFNLIKFLVQHPDQVFSRDELLNEIWQRPRLGKTRTVDVHVRRLRMKLGAALENRLETIVGAGYLFKQAGLYKQKGPS